MEIGNENQDIVTAFAPVIPEKAKNSYIIPWENQDELYISSDHFVELYQGEIPLKDFHLFSYSVKLIKVNKFKWSFFEEMEIRKIRISKFI